MGNMRGQTASTRDQFKIAPVAAGEAVHDFFAKAMHEREISALEQYSDNRVEKWHTWKRFRRVPRLAGVSLAWLFL